MELNRFSGYHQEEYSLPRLSSCGPLREGPRVDWGDGFLWIGERREDFVSYARNMGPNAGFRAKSQGVCPFWNSSTLCFQSLRGFTFISSTVGNCLRALLRIYRTNIGLRLKSLSALPPRLALEELSMNCPSGAGREVIRVLV